MLHWGNQGNIFLFLDSNCYPHTESTYECLCAKGGSTDWSMLNGKDLLQRSEMPQDWLFGHISYDFKNQLEQLDSKKAARFDFPDLQFFRPETVCFIRRQESVLCIETTGSDPDQVWAEICDQAWEEEKIPPVRFRKRIPKEAYLQVIDRLRQHIKDGDCYEINFCNEAYHEAVSIPPLAVFLRLNGRSTAPFAAYYKLADQYLLCASPERYLHKRGAALTAQPIKGTRRRSSDPEEDDRLKQELAQSPKDRAENVMIVDLMRNDLARSCEPGTVAVTELFGIYSFPQVHQMISTIKGQLKPGLSAWDAVRYSFPMGSMTGAPKIMVMKLIEQYEQARRELFSGSVGYIDPEGNFDFNVVIRSLFYNARTQYLGYQTGGAITYDSVPEEEWEETLVKAEAMEKIFQ